MPTRSARFAPSGTRKSLRRAVPLVSAALLAGGLVAAAPSATADPFDPHVVVTGGAGCHAAFYLASSVTFVLDNGETATSRFDLRNYRVQFYNIDPAGTSGTATVTCSDGPNQHYTYAVPVTVTRPPWLPGDFEGGDHETIYLGSG